MTNHDFFSEKLLIVQPRKYLERETGSRKDFLLEENSDPSTTVEQVLTSDSESQEVLVKPHISHSVNINTRQ